jgi:1-acyl-sn-glycerol-3-phosphate acyltransferase
MFATFKLLFVYLTLGIPAGILFIPYTLLVSDVSLLYRIAMWITNRGVRAAGIRIDVSGYENVPPGTACIFMSNHVSNLDPPVTAPLLPSRASILLKKELMSIPILGRAMKLGRFIPVERGSRRDAAQASVAAAAQALAEGLHILVYPEGTRSPDGRLSAFKKGPFFLAMQTRAPIIPVAITPGVARLQFLAPIDPTLYATREDLMRAVRESIAAALPPEMKPAPTAAPQTRQTETA